MAALRESLYDHEFFGIVENLYTLQPKCAIIWESSLLEMNSRAIWICKELLGAHLLSTSFKIRRITSLTKLTTAALGTRPGRLTASMVTSDDKHICDGGLGLGHDAVVIFIQCPGFGAGSRGYCYGPR